MDNILEIENLTKRYKEFTLDNVNITLHKGFIMGIIGENGAGKTTLIKLIMNLIKKDEGSIKVFGKDNTKFEKEIKDRIGFVYDQCYGYESLSLADNGKLLGALYSKWSEEKFKYYLNVYSLNENQKLKELSKGMRMKFSLCMALSHDAEFIIMDEPTAGLDPIVRVEVLEKLQELIQDENKGVIISTHITSDLEKIADYITFIRNGKIAFSESKDEIFDTYKVVKGDINLLNYEVEKLFLGIRKSKYGFEGLTIKETEVRKALGKDIIIDKVSLEDIMILYNK